MVERVIKIIHNNVALIILKYVLNARDMQKYAERRKRYCFLDMPHDTSSSVTIMTTLKLVTPSKNTQNFYNLHFICTNFTIWYTSHRGGANRENFNRNQQNLMSGMNLEFRDSFSYVFACTSDKVSHAKLMLEKWVENKTTDLGTSKIDSKNKYHD